MPHPAHRDDRPRPVRLRPIAWAAAAALLAAPLVAMQFTPEVRWDEADFIVAALLIGGTGLAIELALRLARTPAARVAAASAILAAAFLTWVELAVGIFGPG